MSLTTDSFFNFLINNKWIILFYLGIILLIYFNRKKFEIQAKIIALYRTKFGINAIHNFAKKHSELIKIFGYIGIGIDFRDIKKAVKEIIEGLDHCNLSDLPAFKDENPTSENIARLIYKALSKKINTDAVKVSKVKVTETASAGSYYWEE